MYHTFLLAHYKGADIMSIATGGLQLSTENVIMPGKAIQDGLDHRGWTHDDLADIMGRHRPEISALVSGKRGVTPEIAIALSKSLGMTPEHWMGLETTYRLSLIDGDIKRVDLRRKLYEMAPIREMTRRGWISDPGNLDTMRDELLRFFNIESLNESPRIGVSTRKSDSGEPLTATQLAWCFQARNIASDLLCAPFDDIRLKACEANLKKLIAFAPEVVKVPRVLSDYGIRFVIVQHLSGSKIDGAAMWLDDRRPVIAMSLRLDRIDSFWFTLFHELSHIRHKDGLSVDSNLTGESAEFSATKASFERRADTEAAEASIPQDKLQSFIDRVAPLYSKARIIQFAHRIKVHPGVISGQLQHRGEISFRANREMLVKVRDRVTTTSVVDGWGHSLP